MALTLTIVPNLTIIQPVRNDSASPYMHHTQWFWSWVAFLKNIFKDITIWAGSITYAHTLSREPVIQF